MNARLVAAHAPRLHDRLGRAADQVLCLIRFDPEMRREIRKIRHYRHVRHMRQNAAERRTHGAVEIRHQRHHEVRLGSAPEQP